MSRLDRDIRLIDTYGRHLPTPVVDTVRIQDVSADDEDYITLMKVIDASDELYSLRTETYGESWATTAPKQLTKLVIDLSVLINTTDGFDADALSKELFDNTTDTGDSDSLYVNIIITKNSEGDELRKSRLALKGILQPLTDATEDYTVTALVDTYGTYASPTGNSAYDDASDIESMLGSGDPYVISVPLSDFFTSVRMTTSFDKHNNPILRMSQIQVEGFVKDFNSLDALTVYAALSVGRPSSIAGGPTLSTLAYSLNFSDVTYEHVKKGGSIKLFDDTAYMDSEGNFYPQDPLRALNRKYYKIDNFGPSEIKTAVRQLLGEYENLAMNNPDVREVLDGIAYVLHTYENSADLVMMLEKAADVFPEQAGSTRVGVMYERFRRIVVNINNTLMAQEEVVKRIFKNYKIVDARAFVGIPFDSTSYVKNSNDWDFIYPTIFHSNIAKYVPIGQQSSKFPGEAELPVSPAEREDIYRAKIREIKDDLSYLLTKFTWNEMEGSRIDTPWFDVSNEQYYDSQMARSYADFDGDEYAVFDADPWSGIPASDSFLIKALAEPIKEVYDWIVNVWSIRYVHPLTTYGPNHSGFHGAFSERNRWSDEDRRYPNPTVFSAGCTNNVVGDLGGGGIYIPGNQNRYENTTTRQWFFNKLGSTLNVPDANSSYDKLKLAKHQKWGIPLQELGDGLNESFIGPNHDVIYGDDATSCNKMSPVLASKDASSMSHRMWGLYVNFGRSYGVNIGDVSPPISCHQLEVFVPRSNITEGGRREIRKSQEDWGGTYYEYLDSASSLGTGDVTFLYENSVDPIGGIDVFDVTDAVAPSALGDAKTAAPVKTLFWERKPLYEIKKQVIRIFSSLLGIDPITGFSSIESDPDDLEFNDSDGYSISSEMMADPTSESTSAAEVGWASAVADTDSQASAVSPGSDSDSGGTDTVALAGEILGLTPEGDEYQYIPDMNNRTHLDEYLKDMPRQVGNFLYDWVLNEVDKLDATELNTAAEREAVVNAIISAYLIKLETLLANYLNTNLCTVIIAVQAKERPSIWYSDKPKQYAIQRRIGRANGGATLFPYGDISHTVLQVSNDGSGYSSLGGSGSDNWKVVNIGGGLRNYIRNKFVGADVELRSILTRYIKTKATHIGFQTDTGIHSALASTDIVVKKYGYYFFDLEKYIRKNSLASQFMNVDRFLANVPKAKEMTNVVIGLKSTTYMNPTFNGPFSMRLATADDNAGNIVDFSSLEIHIPNRPEDPLIPQVYNRVEALQNVTFEEIVDTTFVETGNATSDMSSLEFRSVDISYLGESAEWEYSHLAMRNYAFPGFYDSTMGRSNQTWANDYRLACFRYQYFIDDDIAYLGNDYIHAWLAAPEANEAVDVATINVYVKDESQHLIRAMYSHFFEIYSDFRSDYVEFAKDNCTFNDFSLRFNDFFIEAMVSQFGANRSTPWFRMAAAYVLYQNIFTDVFEGDEVQMQESANNILEQIRPETGTLYRLLEFNDKCGDLLTQLKRAADGIMQAGSTGVHATEAFQTTVYISEPVIDHIGDYTEETNTLNYDISDDS